MKIEQEVFGLKGGESNEPEVFCAEKGVGEYHGKDVEVKTEEEIV